MIDINTFGKGAVKAPEALKAMQYKLAEQAPRVIDWNKPWREEWLPVLNQGSSSSCTAHATASYCTVLNKMDHGKVEDYSRRYIYSQASLGPNQGAYIWKAMSIPLTCLAGEQSVPDGLTEDIEIDASLNANASKEARADKYAQLTNNFDMDYLASIIDDYHGFVTGFNGNNEIMATPVIAIPTHVDWGHCVYVYDYGIINGKKVLKFLNSWTNQWGQRGYGFFDESFVKSHFMFDAYVYADITDLDPTSIMLTAKQVKQLQALEGYHDESGVAFWTGKLLSDYLAARLPDKIKTINESI